MNSPIGILDSGLGGLSVFNEIRTRMPDEDIIYIGDSAWCPYGPRSTKEIQRRVFIITDYLIAQGCKIIVIACNSATIAAIEALRATYPLPFVGMEPAVKPAAGITETGTIGVMATEASIAGEKFHKLVHDHAHSHGVTVITRPCPNFVHLVEHGDLDSPIAQRIVEEETIPLIEAGADVLVLGCTHYPFLRPLIQTAAGEKIKILDTGNAVARHVKELLTEKSDHNTPSYRIFTTGEKSTLTTLFPKLCPDLSEHTKTSIDHLEI